MAWSLSNDERASDRKAFVEMDTDKTGVLSLNNIKQVLQKHAGNIQDEEVKRIFTTLDVNHSEEVNYTDFLAAMMTHKIAAQEELILNAFDRFDVDRSGFITEQNLEAWLSVRLKDTSAKAMIAEADFNKDGKISKEEFIKFIKGGSALEVGGDIIDNELEKKGITPQEYRKSQSDGK